jgi:predicted alpha/beta superfamily hydrolase
MTFPAASSFEFSARRPGHTIVGDVRVFGEVPSPQLNNRRDVLVYLPPSYAAGSRPYPVLYMHDGQNLFDRATSYAGDEWQVDETLEALSAEGIEAIVVGINHAGEARITEFNPFPVRSPVSHQVGRGEDYLAFITDTLKPMLDAQFRTRPDRAHTGVFGSSMGGLISLYAFFHRPDVFGLMGAMSPSLWVGRGAIYDFVKRAAFTPGRLYVDNGSREPTAKHLAEALTAKGYRLDHDLRYVLEEGGEHRESAWARRLPDALRFLLKPPA